MTSVRKIVSYKDENGHYIKESEVAGADDPLPQTDTSLDGILKGQLWTLHKATRQLMKSADAGGLNKDEMSSLATLIKVTIDLKLKEKEALEGMSLAELEEAAKDDV